MLWVIGISFVCMNMSYAPRGVIWCLGPAGIEVLSSWIAVQPAMERLAGPFRCFVAQYRLLIVVRSYSSVDRLKA